MYLLYMTVDSHVHMSVDDLTTELNTGNPGEEYNGCVYFLYTFNV